MALAPDRWGAQVANERGGHSRRLPDLAFWTAGDDELRVAVLVVQGQSNPRREGAALEGWQASIAAGQYAQARYLAGPAAASRLERTATSIGLTGLQFVVGDRVMAHELPQLPSVTDDVAEASAAAESACVTATDFPRHEVLGYGEPARRRWWRRGSG
jgi:hypothetical protein